MPRDRPENHYGRQALIRGICDCRTFELNSGFLLRRDLFPRRQDSAGVVFDPVGEHAHLLRDLFAHRGQAVFHMRRYNREGLPMHEAVRLQRLKRLRQHPVTYPADRPPERGKADRPPLKGDQCQDGPATGDMFEDIARWGVDKTWGSSSSLRPVLR